MLPGRGRGLHFLDATLASGSAPAFPRKAEKAIRNDFFAGNLQVGALEPLFRKRPLNKFNPPDASHATR